jgi:four helix bundle protein
VLGDACGIAIADSRGVVARRYDELDAWRLADELKRNVYELVAGSSAQDDRRFCDQIRDSAASATSNLAEGFGYYRHPEFAKHTRTAKSSLIETQDHLGDGVDRGYWSADRARPLMKLADRAIGACVRLLQYLETSDAPGTTGTARRTGTTFTKRER